MNTNDLNKQNNKSVNNALDVAHEAIASIKREPFTFKKKSDDPLYIPHKAVGNELAILSTIFGSLLTTGFGITVLVLLLVEIGGPLLVGMSLALLAGVILDINAVMLFKRLSRYRRYYSLFNGKSFCHIDEITAYTGKNKAYVLNDLQVMINKGMYPQANITEDQTLLLLNRYSFDRYMTELRKRNIQDIKAISKESSVTTDSETSEAITEGREFIKLVAAANQSINDKDVSDKIERLETIINQIVSHIEKHPEQIGNVRRLLQFYLPSTLKLLNAYDEFEKHTIQGEHIITIRKEIKDSLDTINQAFEELFNNLFSYISMDISTDITVLHTMLKDEGLSKKDFDVD